MACKYMKTTSGVTTMCFDGYKKQVHHPMYTCCVTNSKCEKLSNCKLREERE